VKATVQQLFRKLSVRRRVQLVRLALGDKSWREDRSPANRQDASGGPAGSSNSTAVARA